MEVLEMHLFTCDGANNNCNCNLKQEAQLPQRDSASAAHVFLGSLTDRALHWAPDLFYNYIID